MAQNCRRPPLAALPSYPADMSLHSPETDSRSVVPARSLPPQPWPMLQRERRLRAKRIPHQLQNVYINVRDLRTFPICRVRQRACTLVSPPYYLLPLARKVRRLPPIENEPVARILVERTWPATIRTWSSLVPARLVSPRAGGLPKPDSIALLWRPGHALAGGRGRSTLIRPVRSISAAAGSIRPTATHGGNLLRYKTARSTKRRRHGCVLRLQLDFLRRSRPPFSRLIGNFINGLTHFPTRSPT